MLSFIQTKFNLVLEVLRMNKPVISHFIPSSEKSKNLELKSKLNYIINTRWFSFLHTEYLWIAVDVENTRGEIK